MKLNIACPTTGGQMLLSIDDEQILRNFYDQRISDEVAADCLGDAWKGYILRITGGNDKQGFPMKQGVLVNHRVRLLLRPGNVGYRRARHDGERRRRTVRGCIVGNDLSVLNLVIVKKGEAEVPGLTDKVLPRRVGPKRASKIRKLFNLSYEDDVKDYVLKRKRTDKNGKEHVHSPKIQRLVTSRTLQHRRRIVSLARQRRAKSVAEAAAYAKLIRERAAIARKEERARKYVQFRKDKLQHLLALKRAIAEKKERPYAAKKLAAKKLEAYRAKKAAQPKVAPTAEEIEARKKVQRIIKYKKCMEAKKKLGAARKAAMMKIKRDKNTLSALNNIIATPAKFDKLSKKQQRIVKSKQAKFAKSVKETPKILKKAGAVEFLGRSALPYGKKKAEKAKEAPKKQNAPKKAKK